MQLAGAMHSDRQGTFDVGRAARSGHERHIAVTGADERSLKGRIPARSVVIPGMRPRKFPAGEYLVPCALIIGARKESTDRKTSLNAALRDFGVPA